MLAKEKNRLDIMGTVAEKIAAIGSDQRGASAIEFSFFALLLALGLLNTADVSIYIYQRMQLENATQMGVQAVWNTCDPNNNQLPATTRCQPQLTTAITNAVQSTSLGTKASLKPGYPTEGYYCVNSTDKLVLVSDVSSGRPQDCTNAGTPSLKPGDYIQIATTFTYAPLFSITIANLLPKTINSQTAMMRLD